MIIYKDKFTGDEMFTDAYKVVEEKTHYKFTGKQTTRKEGKIDDSLIGANASAEEAQEQTEEAVESGLDFALTAHMNEVGLDKKALQKYLKGYFKKLQDKCVPSPGEDEDKAEYDSKLKEFQTRGSEFAAMVLKNFKDMTFYFGENDYAGENACCFVLWKDDCDEVDVFVFKDGLDQEKY